MEELKILGTDDLRQITEEAKRLEKRILFKEYLLRHQFKQLQDDFFVKTDPPQLIQLFNRDGETYYENHTVRGDNGRLMEFIANRLNENGRVVPLYGVKVGHLVTAVQVALLYLRDKAAANKKVQKRKAEKRARRL